MANLDIDVPDDVAAYLQSLGDVSAAVIALIPPRILIAPPPHGVFSLVAEPAGRDSPGD